MYSIIKDSMVETDTNYFAVVQYFYTMDLDRVLADFSQYSIYAKAILAPSNKNDQILEMIEKNTSPEQYNEALKIAKDKDPATVAYLVFALPKNENAKETFKVLVEKNHPYIQLEENASNILHAISLPTQVVRAVPGYTTIDTAAKIYPLKAEMVDVSGTVYYICEVSEVDSDEELVHLASIPGVVKIFFNSKYLPKSKVLKRLSNKYQTISAEHDEAMTSDSTAPSFLTEKLNQVGNAIKSTKQMPRIFESSRLALVKESGYAEVTTKSGGKIFKASPSVVADAGRELTLNFMAIR